MGISASCQSQSLHSSALHTARHVYGVGSDSREEVDDGFNAAWMTCIAQSSQSDDHLSFIAVSQALIGKVEQWLVKTTNTCLAFFSKMLVDLLYHFTHGASQIISDLF